MNSLKSITPNVAIAGQPSAADLEALKAEGYAGVVNLRNDGEPEQPISTAQEGEIARSVGLDYLHCGFGGAPFDPSGVAAVMDFLDRHSGEKVLVHCRSGGRASAVLLVREAQARGWSASEAAEKGRAMGLDVKGGLQMLVEQYLRAHPKR